MDVVKPRPLYEQVYEAIKQDILNGEFKYEERINEVQISQALNVSRGPVRESVSKLEQEGLLERDSRNYLRVYKPDLQDLTEIYQCRRVLESLAAELAANHITNHELIVLDQLMEKSNKLISIDDTDKKMTIQFLDLNSEFHQIISSASKNIRLINQIGQLKSLTRLYRKFNIHNQERREVAHNQHYGIYTALKQRDSLLVSKRMSEHIKYDMESLIAIFPETF